MVRVTKLWLLLPRPVRRFPPDLAAVVGLVIAAGLAASLPGIRESVLRVLIGAPFVLFVPGYAVTAALFPKLREEDTTDNRSYAGVLPRSHDGITLLERVMFSFGMSVTIVPLVGFALNFTPWGIQFTSLLLSVGGFTITMALLAAVRRWKLPPEERFRIPYDEWYATARSTLFEPSSRVDAALNVVLLVAVLVTAGSGAYAVLGPQEGQSFTEFYLLSENETGALVADDYPTTFGQGESQTFVVGIENNEHRSIEYSVVVQLQQIQGRNRSPTIAESQQVGQFRVRVDANETVYRRQTVTPGITGESLRLQFLLYVGDRPADPTAKNAYRSVHLWVNVTN